MFRKKRHAKFGARGATKLKTTTFNRSARRSLALSLHVWPSALILAPSSSFALSDLSVMGKSSSTACTG